MLRFFITLAFLVASFVVFSQKATLQGTISNVDVATVVLKNTSFYAQVAENGTFKISDIPFGSYIIVVLGVGKENFETNISVNQLVLNFSCTLKDSNNELNGVEVFAQKEKTFGITRLQAVEGFGIYEGKKTEVIVLEDLTANMATNNPRQVFGKVAGLNIWENDRAGLQLSIGARGLNPNRTANFNTRQNGYDIAAESVGYPETYYTPPAEALERIEIVRGAASLQYGPQFGGMVNFKFKQPIKDRKIQLTTRQTVGSWNFFSSFNALSGTHNKVGYYVFFQHKQGDGWRPNSAFQQQTGYANLQFKPTKQLKINIDFTKMYYLAKQAGGLTDLDFSQNPQQSKRARNWFSVDWNLIAFRLEYDFSEKTSLQILQFGNFSSRKSLGNLERINILDDTTQNRTYINDNFKNIGTELRVLHKYSLGNQRNTLLSGIRYYNSYNLKQQGEGDKTNQANFNYLNPNDLENSNYDFFNTNFSAFAENIFNLSEKLSLTPGIRFEHIKTDYKGYYKETTKDFAGNIIASQTYNEQRSLPRNFVLLGAGMSYKPNINSPVNQDITREFYANISQNYRAVGYSDLRIQNPNFSINPNIKDETGFNLDIGTRANHEGVFNYDVSAFFMKYANKIDFEVLVDNLGIEKRRLTNIGTSNHIGIEAFGELNLWKLWDKNTEKTTLSVYSAFTYAYSRYVRGNADIVGNQVPFAPNLMLRTGISWKYSRWKTQTQVSYTGKQFTDAQNTEGRRVSSAVIGSIPAYWVADLSVSYEYKFVTIEATLNNLTDNRYFTRRAESYPGPGIIPSDARGAYLTLQVRL